MSKNKLPIEAKIDLTNVVNEVYNDTFHKILDSSSSTIASVIDFFYNTALYPVQKYNLYAKNKLSNYAIELEERAKEVSAENLVPPKINILGPTIENLKYNIDTDYLKEMFTNILISDMDKTKQDRVLPSYIEIVKQFSKEDANFLKLLKDRGTKCNFPIIQLKFTHYDNSVNYDDYRYLLNYSQKDDILQIDPITLNNLIRLRVISVYHGSIPNQNDIYQYAFNFLRKKHNPFSDNEHGILSFNKRLMFITPLGQEIIDICL